MAEKKELLERRGIRKWGVKIHPFHLPWIRACFIPSDFVQMASVKTFNYSSELRMTAFELFYSEPSRIQTPKMIAVKIVKWIIAWKNFILLPLWRMPSQLKVFLPPASFELDGMTSHKHDLGSKYSRNRILGCFWDEFLQDSKLFRGWNFVEWKSWIRVFTCSSQLESFATSAVAY